MNLNLYLGTSRLVKSYLLPLGYYFPFNKIFSNKRNYAVLCYHRISEKNKSHNKINPLSGLEVNQDIFEKQISYLVNNFKILKLNELEKHIENDDKEFAISITFDDGYLDNINLALPILKKYNTPASIFVITRFLNNKDFMWWYFLWDNLNKKKSIKFNNETIILKNKSDAVKWYGILSKKVINLKEHEQYKFLKNIFDSGNKPNYKHLIFDSRKLFELSKNELIEIGSHTVNHNKLTSLSIDEVYLELKNSKQIIEEIINKKVNYLAYPYGGKDEVDSKIVSIAKEVGYKMAFSTKRISDQTHKFYDIPRYNIDNYSDKKRFISKINGFEDFLYNFKKLIF